MLISLQTSQAVGFRIRSCRTMAIVHPGACWEKAGNPVDRSKSRLILITTTSWRRQLSSQNSHFGIPAALSVHPSASLAAVQSKFIFPPLEFQ